MLLDTSIMKNIFLRRDLKTLHIFFKRFLELSSGEEMNRVSLVTLNIVDQNDVSQRNIISMLIGKETEINETQNFNHAKIKDVVGK